MNRWVSAWPLGGGVVVSPEGVAYAAAGSTAADGAVVAAVDLASGRDRWRQAYTLDRPEPALSFGVQSNLLLHGQQAADQWRRARGHRGARRASRHTLTNRRPVGQRPGDVSRTGRRGVLRRSRALLEPAGADDHFQAASGARLFSHVRAAHRPNRRPTVRRPRHENARRRRGQDELRSHGRRRPHLSRNRGTCCKSPCRTRCPGPAKPRMFAAWPSGPTA
jgi:hypothetical protein